jgi:hypothetical protein
MSLQVDPQVLAELAPLMAAAAEREPPPVGDVASRRTSSALMFEQLTSGRSEPDGVEVQNFTLGTDDGAALALS